MTLNNFTKILPCALFVLLYTNMAQGQTTPSNKPQVSLTSTPPATPAAVIKTLFGPYSSEKNTNYVRTRSGLVPITDKSLFDAATYEKVNQSTQYLDGLARPIQQVVKQITPGSDPKDMVTTVEYDDFGREVYKYLPYVQTTGDNTNDGRFKLDPFHMQDNFYKNVYKDANGKLMFDGEKYLYSQTVFEASPLNRINKVMAPGNSWTGQEKGTSQQRLVNTESEGVRLWTIGNTSLTLLNEATANIPTSAIGAVYKDGELHKNFTIDEHGSAVVEYSNKEGQLVLKKVEIGSVLPGYGGHDDWLCTYYVYDDLNQLRFVIPPAAVQSIKGDWILTTRPTVIAELCFRYEYDERGRMINKKVPGAGWTEMIYDGRDRLVYIRDGNMRDNHQWMVTMYDHLNRPVVTGMLVPCELTRTDLQPLANSAQPKNISFNGNALPSRPPRVSITALAPGTTLIQASISITFEPGANTDDSGPIVAEIVPELPTTITTQVTATDPRPSGVPFVALTITSYDSYDQATVPSYSDTYNIKLFNVGTSEQNKINLAPEALLTNNEQANVQTRGLVTSTKVRILEDPTNLSTGKWLTTTMFYDQKARVLQSNSENATGGRDITTFRYDFTGKALANYLVHNNPKGASTTTVKSLMKYDFAGRLLTITKTINGLDNQAMEIVSNTFDEMGNLKTKELGKRRNEAGPLEKLDYNYNIRGWVKGINAAYSHPELASTAPDRWFGMELNYDYGSETNRNQYNGNISSTIWRSKGDGVQRAYGYTYDKANRIMSADFSERAANASTYSDNALVNFDMVMTSDDTPQKTGYDANGNIKGMTQWGMKFNSSTAIDQMSYEYFENTNKLKSVSEKLPQFEEKSGDFKDNNNGDDYGYDKNGNMIADLNRHIGTSSSQTGINPNTLGAITYNHLNLPWKIDVAGKGTIKYIYDAVGTKLSKIVDDSEVPEDKITDYVGGMVYEQNILQFIPHEEGRTRLTNKEGLITQNNDYFIKDHLGNVRTVLTDEIETIMYPAATMETDQV